MGYSIYHKSDKGFRTNFEVKEVNKVLEKFNSYDNRTRMKIEKAIKHSCEAIVRGAKRRVPVRTGYLKTRIEANYNTNLMSGYVAVKAPYAHLVEFGHGGPEDGAYISDAKEHPFMRPAYEEEIPNLIKNVKSAVQL